MCKKCDTKAPKFSVKPFEGKNSDQQRWSDEDIKLRSTACAICGKPVRDPWPHTAVVVAGGDAWGDLNSDENDRGYMGCWPIGRDCYRRFVIKEG
jgi:hypothetical protein